ncbi:hypothetical protein M409DRAFT_64697 [Zasmidium cellare ATCC 36951]|uniref:Protein-L-isoaspartate O-methyltransferase n=1 Tax=Zasmidium cellare ATCC 36951 TaxID=1080233 RepID=A0A6A6CSE7_ZASCE|nr:uncharacterized protein M409DRAFT_64697 [Zasmidium cellare ATCC 36951]KAF2169623.1 hypothetical protein M409DRAFT_64697 [Zasmidium cellare ATCC 36951]
MAWRSSGATNEALIGNLSQNGLITSERVKNAMKGVDRAHYAPTSPYQDSPQSIGHRATISAPHMHASAAESLLPYLFPGAKVLDVGSGSGYLTHVLAELVKPGGKVVGVEHIQALVEMGQRNTGKSAEGRELLASGALEYRKADGRLGWPQEAPYDAIHVGAAAAGHQEKLIEQLRSPGRLFIPVEEAYNQHIYVVDKDEQGNVTKKKEYGVQYVPLTDAPPGD